MKIIANSDCERKDITMNLKKLIIYYSMDGNTKKIAEKIQAVTGADIERLDTVIPYTGTDEEIVDQGQREVNQGYMPEIKPLLVNVADYDTIIIGTPTWWYTMAPAVLTFLNSNSLEGKTVIPFQTHAGWPGHALQDMGNACKGSSVENSKAIQFSSKQFGLLVTAESEVDHWIETLK